MSTSTVPTKKSIEIVRTAAFLGTLCLGVYGLHAQLLPPPQAVSSVVMRAAQIGDDQRFATALAAEKIHLVLFLTTPFQWGSNRPVRVNPSQQPATLPDAIRVFALNHPEVSLDGSRSGVVMGTMPATHCAAPVLGERIENWSFSGKFQDFARAFDRMTHHIEDVVEGGTVGFKPPADSPLFATVNITAQHTTVLDAYLNALSQLDGAVVIFRNARDETGEIRCLRETYLRDVSVTSSVGFERNPGLFSK